MCYHGQADDAHKQIKDWIKMGLIVVGMALMFYLHWLAQEGMR